MLEQASASEDRGAFGTIDCEAIDCLLGLEDGATAAILAAMGERGLVDGGAVSQHGRNASRNGGAHQQHQHGAVTRTPRQKATPIAARRRQQLHATPEIDDATPCNATKHQKKPRGEESREEKKEYPYPPGGRFDEFWSAYPKKVGKDDARRAFKKRKHLMANFWP